MNKPRVLQISCHIFICCLFGFSSDVMSENGQHEICFNFTIITKAKDNVSEISLFNLQKDLIIEQLSRTQSVFDKNIQRNCPKVKFKQEIIQHINWNNALRLSQAIDQDIDEPDTAYRERKSKEHVEKITSIATTIKQTPDIKYYSLLELSPGKAIVNAETVLQEINSKLNNTKDSARKNELESLRFSIQESMKIVSEKLNSYAIEEDDVILNRARIIFSKYKKIDQASADSWREGNLIFWNDASAQDTSVELKNLIRLYHAQENQCLDVYIVPKGKSPSKTNNNKQKNGDWTIRGGAALSEKYFPRTTAGRGHAIVLTQDGRKSESRLAHELGHLLIDKPDAHFGKEAKDLMHMNSLGGTYLDEEECKKIKENITSF